MQCPFSYGTCSSVSCFILLINIKSKLFIKCVCIMFLYREHLIDTNIEQSVSNMQNIIEMGRIMRDRKTIPVKVIKNNNDYYWL